MCCFWSCRLQRQTHTFTNPSNKWKVTGENLISLGFSLIVSAPSLFMDGLVFSFVCPCHFFFSFAFRSHPAMLKVWLHLWETTCGAGHRTFIQSFCSSPLGHVPNLVFLFCFVFSLGSYVVVLRTYFAFTLRNYWWLLLGITQGTKWDATFSLV